MRPPRLALVLLATLAGCGDPTALDLSLVADPNVNSEASLVEKLTCIRVVVDSSEGLYPGGADRREGDLLISDIDSDGQGELVAGVGMADLGRLPLIRVEQGGLSDPPLELRIDGRATGDADACRDKNDATVAAGGVQGIYFSADGVQPVQVPFNLRAEYRPPRVTQVYPEDGANLSLEIVGSVVLIFSKQMDNASLTRPGVIQLIRVQGSQESAVAIACVPGEVWGGGPTKADCKLAATLSEGSYRVRVSQGALDTSGRSLDQAALQPGNQPFSSQFEIGPTVAQTASCPPMCESLWCGNGGTRCPSGLTCVDQRCVPDSCPASCGPLMVCDATHAVCVEDCRMFGTYCGVDGDDPTKLLSCDQQTGLCE